MINVSSMTNTPPSQAKPGLSIFLQSIFRWHTLMGRMEAAFPYFQCRCLSSVPHECNYSKTGVNVDNKIWRTICFCSNIQVLFQSWPNAVTLLFFHNTNKLDNQSS
jgi:hypothetical protein